MMSVSVGAIRKWKGEGKIVFVKLGASVRYKLSDVRAFRDGNRQIAACPQCGHTEAESA